VLREGTSKAGVVSGIAFGEIPSAGIMKNITRSHETIYSTDAMHTAVISSTPSSTWDCRLIPAMPIAGPDPLPPF